MKTTLALGLLLLSGLGVTSAQANECTTDALMQGNQRLQAQVESYVEAHSDEPGQAMREMNGAMADAGVQDTLQKHADELKKMEPGSDHQPSQALCDDMYAMFDRAHEQMSALD